MYQAKGKNQQTQDSTAGVIYINAPKDGKKGYLNISLDLSALGLGEGKLGLKAFKNDNKKENKHPDFRILKPLSASTSTARKPATSATQAASSNSDTNDFPF